MLITLSKNMLKALPETKQKALSKRTPIYLAMMAGLFVMASCSEDDNTTLKSPVQAVTTIFEMEDGTVVADLYLISTTNDEHVFVNEATNVEIRVPGGSFVILGSKGKGRYSNDSKTDPNLEYIPGETYQFKFELAGDAAGDVSGGDFIAVVDAPADVDVVFTYDDLPGFAGDDSGFTWTPGSLRGILTVKDSDGNTVYQNFDFSNPTFSGDKWATLFNNGNGTLSVDAYKEAGTYNLEFCAVSSAQGFSDSLSAELGALSGFLVGECVNYDGVIVTQ
jgi:hypothetical protein